MRHLHLGLLKETFARFGADQASLLAAAIAYTAVFAIAPLLVIVIAIAGGVLGFANGGHGHHVIENQIVAMASQAAGAQSGETIRSLITAAFSSHQGSALAQLIGWLTFVLAASGLFLTLQTALNNIWHVDPKQQGLMLTIRNRAASGLMLLAAGILVLISIFVNIAISFVWNHFTALMPFPGASYIASAISYLVDIAILTVTFGMIYKVLPDTEIGWDDVKVGAIATSVLFVVGEALLSVYLSHAGIANGYGAAGSLVVLLVWVYYSSMLFLIGAEFTRVYAEMHGSRASQRVAQDGDPATRGATGRTAEGATVPSQRGEEDARTPGVTSA